MRSIIKKEFTLSNEEQEILARACRIKKFKYAETIYNEVDDRTHYYYLINGNIEITKLYGDREVPFYYTSHNSSLNLIFSIYST